MKLLLLAVVIFLVAADDKYKVREDIAEQWEKVVENHRKECVKESGEKEENVRDIYKKGYFPNTPEFKHYVKCLGIKLNVVSEDGIFNEDIFRNIVKAGDLDIFEDALAEVHDEKDIYEKTYLFVTGVVQKIADRYPPQH